MAGPLYPARRPAVNGLDGDPSRLARAQEVDAPISRKARVAEMPKNENATAMRLRARSPRTSPSSCSCGPVPGQGRAEVEKPVGGAEPVGHHRAGEDDGLVPDRRPEQPGGDLHAVGPVGIQKKRLTESSSYSLSDVPPVTLTPSLSRPVSEFFDHTRLQRRPADPSRKLSAGCASAPLAPDQKKSAARPATAPIATNRNAPDRLKKAVHGDLPK